MTSTAVESRTAEQARQESHDFVKDELLRACTETIRPRILSINNGLLPEARAALNILPAGRGVFLAVETEAETSEMVGRWYVDSALRSVCGDIFGLPRESYDFIYSRTLLSTLTLAEARRTILRLIWLLAPGGRLLLTGFTSAAQQDIAATKIKARCWTETQLQELVSTLPQEALLGHSITLSPSGISVFVEAQA